jgi:hypothetical protein
MAGSDQGAHEWFSAGAGILRKAAGHAQGTYGENYSGVMRADYSLRSFPAF